MVTVYIKNGEISTGTIPRMPGYQEFTNELEKTVPLMYSGQIALDPNIGIMAEIYFINNASLNIMTRRKGTKIYYSLNNNVYDREEAVRALSDFRNKAESTFKQSNKDISAKELYNKLLKSCPFRNNDGGIEVFDNVKTGGSGDSWSSYGDRLKAYLEGDKIRFVYEKIDRGSTHIDWNDSSIETKYYPGDISANAIRDICVKNGVMLK